MAWHKNDPEAKFIASLMQPPLAFHRTLVDIPVVVNGKRTRLGILGALMLSQAIFWQVRTEDPEGWFFKSREQWEEEIGMSRREQETARRRLRATPFWEEQMRGFPVRLHYRVNLTVLKHTLEAMTAEAIAAASEAEDVETTQPVGTDAPNRGKADQTAQPVGTDAPNRGETDQTAQPVGTDAPNRGETDQAAQPVGTDAPNRGKADQTAQPVGTNAPSQLVQMRPSSWRESAHPVGTNAPNWAEGALKEFLTKTTSESTSKTTAITTHVRDGRRASAPKPPAAAVVVAELPAEIREALKTLGWTGSMGEIAEAWQQDPERVRAWIAYAQRKHWTAPLLRVVLREDPGYPPSAPDPAQQYLGDYVPYVEADDETDETETNLPESVQQWWQLTMGQLAHEMPKVAFDTWVRPAQPVAFDDGVLTVAVANSYARDWLEARLVKTLERKMTGFAGQQIHVQFVVR